MMEKQTGRIVVGYDGSAPAARAVEWAARDARRRGCPLTVLTVVDYGGLSTTPPAGTGYDWPEAALLTGQEVTDKGVSLARAVDPAVEVIPLTVPGTTAALLIEASRSADLLVVATRGRGDLRTLLLGSVAAAVAAHGRCPVVVVRGKGDDLPGPDRPVVVGVDGSPAARAALDFAAGTAEQAGAPLVVVCAWDALAGGVWAETWSRGLAPQNPELRPGERQLARQALDDAVARVQTQHPGVDVRPVLAENQPAVALVDAGIQAGAGLLVLGTRGHGVFTSLLLGSVSHAVVHAATVPVAVVRGEVPEQVRESEAPVPAATSYEPMPLL
ncbi:MAG TPA: universal stress protein [Kineosporiaceae bacterium]|nr:universal stress protein [Kineosporiaceae bacterium]